MPYIPPTSRTALTLGSEPNMPGELNFVITDVIDDYLIRMGVTYTSINEVIGVLECAKLELYRRIVAPYEDHKKEQHGDVYFCTGGNHRS
jgi:hypothetical protein